MSRENKQKIYLYWLIASLIVLTFIIAHQLNNPSLILANKEQIVRKEVINKQRWQPVTIGGGGYVTGIYAHPQVADLVYMQTDNGGAYRWNPRQKSWHNIIDDFPRLPWNYYGVEALALDPQNPELVYLALGKYTASGNGRLWKSSDRGQTWVESDLQVPMGGDEDKRWAGNRLVVSPKDGNILLFGSRLNGLWRSRDGGLHWSQVNSFQVNSQADPNYFGLIAIAFDPQDPNQVYLSAYGDGIYQSDDAGLTWTKMKGSPANGMRMIVSGDRSVYVTSDISPGVSKYINNVWQDITPFGYQGQIFNALNVHPNHPNQIIVALGEVSGGEIFYSTNGGKTWKKKSTRSKSKITIPWWPDYFFNDHTSAIIFDPFHSQRVWLSDWFGVWMTDNFQDNRPIWTNYPQGQEQLVTFSLLSPPKGAILLSGVADVEGFYHHNLNTYPQDRLGYENSRTIKHWDRYWQDTYDLAYCINQPLNLVRVGGKRDDTVNMVASSNNGGLTWYRLDNFPDDKIPLRVAISATNPQQFVVIRSEGQPLQTMDNGKSWQKVSGLPNGIPGPWNWVQPIAADGVNGNRFYYYAGGRLYRSNDGGVNFLEVNSSLPSVEDYVLKTVPGKEDEVWLSLDQNGIYVSRDGGINFTPIPQVEQSKLLAFGKPEKLNNFPFLYLYGKVINQGEGLFRSRDQGKSWRKLNDISLFNQDEAKTILVLEASWQKSGLIFIGTDGRGIYYQNIS
jgi:xyloglucan-specific exo-beta-1,4-glucanase